MSRVSLSWPCSLGRIELREAHPALLGPRSILNLTLADARVPSRLATVALSPGDAAKLAIELQTWVDELARAQSATHDVLADHPGPRGGRCGGSGRRIFATDKRVGNRAMCYACGRSDVEIIGPASTVAERPMPAVNE